MTAPLWRCILAVIVVRDPAYLCSMWDAMRPDNAGRGYDEEWAEWLLDWTEL